MNPRISYEFQKNEARVYTPLGTYTLKYDGKVVTAKGPYLNVRYPFAGNFKCFVKCMIADFFETLLLIGIGGPLVAIVFAILAPILFFLAANKCRKECGR